MKPLSRFSPTRSARSARFTRRPAAALVVATALVTGLGVIAAVPTSAATIGTSGDNQTHDPSRIAKDGNTYYVYSTGSTIPMKYSTDMKHWTNGPAVFPNGIPSSLQKAVPGFDGNVWAPDLLYANGQWRLYYAVWGSKTSSAIGLATSPTLNPSASNYHWTDQGVVVQATTSTEAQAIDPGPFVDASGNDWLSWGSGYPYSSSQPEIFVMRLHNSTGKAYGSSVAVGNGHEEGSYVDYRDGYYYLFWNTGSCCSGSSSTYTIHVARSTSPTGPYTERSTHFLSSTSTEHGPGQIGIFSQNGTDYYTYHYYPNSGTSVLGLGTISWGSDGWPNS